MILRLIGARAFALIPATIVLATASPTQAQTVVLQGFSLHTHAGVGYVIDAPYQLTGIGGFLFGPQLAGWGLYVDAKRTHESPRDDNTFTRDITVDQAESEFGDRFLNAEEYWTGINAAAVHVLSGSLAVYAGAGYASKTQFSRYYDETRERGLLGTYLIEDPAESGSRVNVLAGAFFRASRRLVFQFGVEAAPRGASVGAYIAQPFDW